MSTEILGPLTTQLGIGGIGGLIDINYDKLINYADSLVGQSGQFSVPSFLISNLPFAGSFALGFSLGFSKG